jgi:hypothetical protein
VSALISLEVFLVVEAESKARVCAAGRELQGLCYLLPLFFSDDGVNAAAMNDLAVEDPEVELLEAKRGESLNGRANGVAKYLEGGVKCGSRGEGGICGGHR